jgi:polyhydroxybutyrate depolymerase
MRKRSTFLSAIICTMLLVSAIACSQMSVSVSENKTAVPPSTPIDRDYPGVISVGGLQRTYLMHLPTAFDRSHKWPLVIVLHGGGGQGRGLNTLADFNSVSDNQSFVVVYPDGYEHNWNDGRGDAGIKAQAENIDDVGFISALIDHLVAELNVDPAMVYATGISNGAMMSYRLGAQLANKIAAIAPVAGNIPEKTISVWSPSRPVSVLIINGTEDPLVPFEGGEVSFLSLKRGKVASVADSVKFWVSKDGCPSAPQTRQLPHINPADPTSTTIADYQGCRSGTEVVLYTVKEGGHTWPGGLQYMSEKLIGKTSRDFNATETIWQFFKDHPMQ